MVKTMMKMLLMMMKFLMMPIMMMMIVEIMIMIILIKLLKQITTIYLPYFSGGKAEQDFGKKRK